MMFAARVMFRLHPDRQKDLQPSMANNAQASLGLLGHDRHAWSCFPAGVADIGAGLDHGFLA